MEKSKLGISVALFGAALFFTGFLGVTPLVLLAGYVLLFEQDIWLKKTAVKAALIVIFFNILLYCVNLVGYVPAAINNLWGVFGGTFRYNGFNNLLGLCRNIINFVQVGLLLLCGFSALNKESFKIGFIDKIVNKCL